MITNTTVLPIGGKEYKFRVLGPSSLNKLADYANMRLMRLARESMQGCSPTEIARTLRGIGTPYSAMNINEVLDDLDVLQHYVWLAFSPTNPDVSKEEFIDMCEQEDWAHLFANIDKIDPRLVANSGEIESDPPEAEESAK